METKSGDGRINRRKLSHEVADRLIAEIESGRLPPGSKLPSERDLMETYGVGRPAVREALQALEAMGLIEITHGERATVKQLDPRVLFTQMDRAARHLLLASPKMLEHLKQARLLFEVGMVKIATEKAGEDDIERLRACIEEQEKSSNDPAAFVAADIRFHETITAIAGNPIFVALSEAMLNWLQEFRIELLRVPGAENVTVSEHRKMLDRIAAHDVEGAAAEMTKHLTRASALYRNPKSPELQPVGTGDDSK